MLTIIIVVVVVVGVAVQPVSSKAGREQVLRTGSLEKAPWRR